MKIVFRTRIGLLLGVFQNKLVGPRRGYVNPLVVVVVQSVGVAGVSVFGYVRAHVERAFLGCDELLVSDKNSRIHQTFDLK
ncbi:MAG: hypothetical protein LBK41_05585 [Clostridiales bacterium]|jgi:hypothetical protein|nr:hypothetical protein [Clostridiales bacterium]